MNKLEFLEMYLDFYMNPFVVFEEMQKEESNYVVLDISKCTSQG